MFETLLEYLSNYFIPKDAPKTPLFSQFSQIESLMKTNSKISIRALAQATGISKSAIQKQVKQFQEKGYITKTTNNNTSGWAVLIKCVSPE